MEINFFGILSYFVIYSFLGWCLESVFRSICEKKIINTGFLFGPVCPIYGVGAILMVLIMGKLQGNIVAIFFYSLVVLTIWEYVVGVFLEKTFKTKYWDYSEHKINFQGRICLTNSLCWGILGVAFINYINPFVVDLVSKANMNIFKIAIYISIIIILIDMIVSIIKVKNIKTTWKKVQELNEEIKEKLKEIKENTQNKKHEKTKVTENVQLVVDDLKKKRNRIIRKLYRYVFRLKKAFPAINTKEITEILNKKVILKRNKAKEKRRK